MLSKIKSRQGPEVRTFLADWLHEEELELTIHRGEDPVQDAPLLEIREKVPEGQAPSPSWLHLTRALVRLTAVNY
jgi:hypothetical protein